MVTQREVHELAKSKGWYELQQRVEDVLCDPELIKHVRATWHMARLMLIVTEVAETAECVRVRDYQGEELADISIRLKDYAESLGVDLEAEENAKHWKNSTRPHKHGGKVL